MFTDSVVSFLMSFEEWCSKFEKKIYGVHLEVGWEERKEWVVIPVKYFRVSWSMSTHCWYCFGHYKPASACRITWFINFLPSLLLNKQDKLLDTRSVPILSWKGRETSTELRTTERATFILDQSETSGQFYKISLHHKNKVTLR